MLHKNESQTRMSDSVKKVLHISVVTTIQSQTGIKSTLHMNKKSMGFVVIGQNFSTNIVRKTGKNQIKPERGHFKGELTQ